MRIMVAQYTARMVCLHPLKDFGRKWPEIHQIAAAPDIVKPFMLFNGFQCANVGMDIGNQQDSHGGFSFLSGTKQPAPIHGSVGAGKSEGAAFLLLRL